MDNIKELYSKAAQLKTNFNALQKLYDDLPRKQKEDDPHWEPYSEHKGIIDAEARSNEGRRRSMVALSRKARRRMTMPDLPTGQSHSR